MAAEEPHITDPWEPPISPEQLWFIRFPGEKYLKWTDGHFDCRITFHYREPNGRVAMRNLEHCGRTLESAIAVVKARHEIAKAEVLMRPTAPQDRPLQPDEPAPQ